METKINIKQLIDEMVEEDLKIISKNDIKKDKIFLAGHQGLVGSAIFKLLKKGDIKTLL